MIMGEISESVKKKKRATWIIEQSLVARGHTRIDASCSSCGSQTKRRGWEKTTWNKQAGGTPIAGVGAR